MQPESRLLLESIQKRDTALAEQERALLQALLSGTMPAMKTAGGLPAAPLMERQAVATYYTVSEDTVRRLEKSGELLPLYITPDCPRYDPQEVESFLAKRRAIRASRGGPVSRRPIKPSRSVSLQHVN